MVVIDRPVGDSVVSGQEVYSRRDYESSRDSLFQVDNPVTKPTREQEKTLQTLQDALERDARNTKVSDAGIRGITLQKVPDAYTGFVPSIA